MEAFVDTMLPLQACSLIAEGKNNLLFNGIISKTCQLYERKGTRGMQIFQVFDALNYWACQAAKIVNRQWYYSETVSPQKKSSEFDFH